MVVPLLENFRKNRPKWCFRTSKIHCPTDPLYKRTLSIRPSGLLLSFAYRSGIYFLWDDLAIERPRRLSTILDILVTEHDSYFSE